MKRNIPYGHQSIDAADIKAVVKVLKSDWLTQGPAVEEFERAVAQYCGAQHGVAVSSGTAALHLAYFVAGITKGDEVITTPLTFVATSNMIATLGAKPVFVDIDLTTLNINPELIEKAITKKTKAIAVVDFGGHPCDYDAIKKIAKKHKLLLIEDACHALGAEYLPAGRHGEGKKVGSLSDMTVLSFHPVKHITTGEGGMVLTNSKSFYEKLKMFRSHGIVKKPEKGGWYYEIEKPFFNYRISDFQCALGLSQLTKLDTFVARRRAIADIYNKQFANVPEIVIPPQASYATSSWHLYPIQVAAKDRKRIFEALRAKGIGVQVHYMPLHLHPFYQEEFGYKKGDFPKAEKYYNSTITLPLYPSMTNGDITYVVDTVKTMIKNG